MLVQRLVVFVAPKTVRVTEFMKQVKSERFFMPVWSLDELLECQEAVFSDVERTRVEDAFRVGGGDARAVFSPGKFQQMKDQMEDSVVGVDVDSLRDAAMFDSVSYPSGTMDDPLFHIYRGVSNKYEDYSVDFASEVAAELVDAALQDKEVDAVLRFLATALSQTELGKRVGKDVLGRIFESTAHRLLSDPNESGRTFKIRTLAKGGSRESVEARFSIDSRDVLRFEGNTFPSTPLDDTYFKLAIPSFPTIDSFFVGSDNGIVYYFQMKIAGIKAVNGTLLEEYHNIVKSNDKPDRKKKAVLVYVVPE